MGELHPYCTVWRKKSKKIKINMEKIWVVHSIELHLLYTNQVFFQLSVVSFREKSNFIKKCIFSEIFRYNQINSSEIFWQNIITKWVFIYCFIYQLKGFEKENQMSICRTLSAHIHAYPKGVNVWLTPSYPQLHPILDLSVIQPKTKTQ